MRFRVPQWRRRYLGARNRQRIAAVLRQVSRHRLNNVDPMQIGRIQVIVPDVSTFSADLVGDAVRAGRPAFRWACSPCRRSAPACGSSSSRAIPTIRSGSDATGAARRKCRCSRTRRRRRSRRSRCRRRCRTASSSAICRGRPAASCSRARTGATLIVNDTGIYIQNGKGASLITLIGPTVTVNEGALTVI